MLVVCVGGVSVEEWERGTPELVTSCSVDSFHPSRGSWESLPSLPEGVSNPAVAVYRDQLYIFGGIRKRRFIRSCYRYLGGGWEELPALPAEFCYPAVVVDEERGGVWLLGGMDGNYVTRTETYLYLPDQGGWRRGPSLNKHRKSAFAFQTNG